MSEFNPGLPKHLRIPPKCDIEYLGVVSIKECERLQREAMDGVFYVWTEVGYSQIYSGRDHRPTKAYVSRYTIQERMVMFPSRSFKTVNRPTSFPVEIGGKIYTEEKYDSIVEEYGQGFLENNPHFPAPGVYIRSNGNVESPMTREAWQEWKRITSSPADPTVADSKSPTE